jgi:predicted phage baseplate assembly protein
MSQPCGCCAGLQIITPESEANPPGQTALNYRVGTYATFCQTMLARLSTLPQLTTRESSDPAIALLDAWAIVADVLTFYQERIANEGYLPTAIERRSLLELARLVNYTLRPGVSASVYLAFTMQSGYTGVIPAGTRAQSIPAGGQLPQFFETSADLNVSAVWNDLQPRLTGPQSITPTTNSIYFQGLTTNLKVGDSLIVVTGTEPALRQVAAVIPEPTDQRTQVSLLTALPAVAASPAESTPVSGQPEQTSALRQIDDLIAPLALPPSLQPPDSISLARTPMLAFAAQSDAAPRLLAQFHPAAAGTLYQAWAGITPDPGPAAIYAARVKCGIFANNFPGAVKVTQTPVVVKQSPTTVEEPARGAAITTTSFTLPVLGDGVYGLTSAKQDLLAALPLDAVYDQITVGSMVVITRPALDEEKAPSGRKTTYHQVRAVQTIARETENSAGPTGFTARVTQLTLDPNWLSDLPVSNEKEQNSTLQAALQSTAFLRETVIYAQAEALPLAEAPLDTDVSGANIELDGLYAGLESGRWVIVSGERTDIRGTTGVTASEVVMLAAVSQNTPASPSDTVHTSLVLANKLAYAYDPSTVSIYGNVALATNGQSVGEVLGSGNASQAFQTFGLHQSPLTFLSAATPSGAQDTLTVTVNEIAWQETGDLSALGPNDHAYTILTGNSGQTTTIFGNGANGARLPTGSANVKAVYRYGLGSAGNVSAQQISQLTTQPGGIQSVINPLPATGGADPDSVSQARANTPLAVMALDRLVSIQDYADFSRNYAGIGKAAAGKLSNGRRQLVFVTIAGAEDIPIALTSNLYLNLVQSLEQFGDPYLPILVGVRNLKLLVIAAGIQVLPGYQFKDVEPAVQTTLLDIFSFDRRSLGQPAFLSEAIAAIQAVAGVAFVNVTVFDSVNSDATAATLASLSTTLSRRAHVAAKPAYVSGQAAFQIQPAELVYLTPAIADTLILTEITSTNAGSKPKSPTRKPSRIRRSKVNTLGASK